MSKIPVGLSSSALLCIDIEVMVKKIVIFDRNGIEDNGIYDTECSTSKFDFNE